MKYKIGDKVRVRSDLVLGQWYGNLTWKDYREKFKGIETEIVHACPNYKTYKIKNIEYFWFSGEMLEPIETKGDDNVSVWEKVLDIINEVHGTDIGIGEEFEIVEYKHNNPYKFIEDGLIDCCGLDSSNELKILLKNTARIKQLPRKPKGGERYYMPNIIGGEPKHFITHWTDHDICHKRFDANMVCKTEEEAIEKAKKMLEAIK